MVEIRIKINEDGRIETKNICGIGTEINIEVIGKNSTKYERKASEFILGKLNLEDKIQFCSM